MDKPKFKLDECLCSGCWKVEKADVALADRWKSYDFKYLDVTVLCPVCQHKFGDDFDKLRENGL